ncbi:MAG: hypothetical protein Q9216_004438 [Gyalolechia sp. 2 TL-2023]
MTDNCIHCDDEKYSPTSPIAPWPRPNASTSTPWQQQPASALLTQGHFPTAQTTAAARVGPWFQRVSDLDRCEHEKAMTKMIHARELEVLVSACGRGPRHEPYLHPLTDQPSVLAHEREQMEANHLCQRQKEIEEYHKEIKEHIKKIKEDYKKIKEERSKIEEENVVLKYRLRKILQATNDAESEVDSWASYTPSSSSLQGPVNDVRLPLRTQNYQQPAVENDDD